VIGNPGGVGRGADTGRPLVRLAFVALAAPLILSLALLLAGCASVCVVEWTAPPHVDCKTIGER